MSGIEIRSEALGGSRLSLAVQRGELPPGWICTRPHGAGQWSARAHARRGEQEWRASLAALAPALDATGEAARRLERVMDGNGVFVTTGQQPGLFGGPLYTWTKAVSALALADAIEAHTGIPASPLFWAATDDADFAESAETFLARAGGVVAVRASLEPPAGTPMSLAPLGALDEAFVRLAEACGSASDQRALAATRHAYGDPARTIGESFVRLLRNLLAPLGIPVIDASHPAVARASRSTLDRALARGAEVDAALVERSAALRARAYEPQVELVNGLSLVFARDGQVKKRVPLGTTALPMATVLTPNVLLRPIVEQAILPTIAYVAGPGELAYFAQVGAAAAALGVAPPLAVPRWSSTIVEPRVAGLLSKYETTVEELTLPDRLEGRLARDAMSGGSAEALERVRSAIASLPRSLAGESGALGLTGAVEGAMQGLQHRLDRLERRLVAGIKRRESGVMQDVATLRAALRPFGGPQERTLNALPFLARHGLELLNELAASARPHAEQLVADEGSSSSPAR